MKDSNDLREKLTRAWEAYHFYNTEHNKWYSTFSSASLYPHRSSEARKADTEWRKYIQLREQTKKYIDLLLSGEPLKGGKAPYRCCDLCGVENPTHTWGDCKVCELHYDMLSSGWFSLSDF